MSDKIIECNSFSTAANRTNGEKTPSMKSSGRGARATRTILMLTKVSRSEDRAENSYTSQWFSQIFVPPFTLDGRTGTSSQLVQLHSETCRLECCCLLAGSSHGFAPSCPGRGFVLISGSLKRLCVVYLMTCRGLKLQRGVVFGFKRMDILSRSLCPADTSSRTEASRRPLPK